MADKTKKISKAALDQAINEFMPGLVKMIPAPILETLKAVGLTKVLPLLGVAASALVPEGDVGEGLSDLITEFTAELRKAVNEQTGEGSEKEEGRKEDKTGKTSNGLMQLFLCPEVQAIVPNLMVAMEDLFRGRSEKEVAQIIASLNQLSPKELLSLLSLDWRRRQHFVERLMKIKPDDPKKSLSESLKEAKAELSKLWTTINEEVTDVRLAKSRIRVNLFTLGFPIRLTLEENTLAQSLFLHNGKIKMNRLAAKVRVWSTQQPPKKKTRIFKFW